jgi:hypothetical protein
MKTLLCLFLAGCAWAADISFRQSGFGPKLEGWSPGVTASKLRRERLWSR